MKQNDRRSIFQLWGGQMDVEKEMSTDAEVDEFLDILVENDKIKGRGKERFACMVQS